MRRFGVVHALNHGVGTMVVMGLYHPLHILQNGTLVSLDQGVRRKATLALA